MIAFFHNVLDQFSIERMVMKKDSPPQTQRTHMADDVLRTRRLRRENQPLLCAPSVLSVSAAVR